MVWSKTAFIFPGQGSQAVGMGQDFFEAYPLARETYQQADELLGFKLSELCFNGPQTDLDDTINTQPALYVTSVAMLRVLQAELPTAQSAAVAGHSLGELTALTAAGALNFEDGVALVRERGRLMKQAGEQQPGAMAALLGLDLDTAKTICEQATLGGEGTVIVANDNCPGQVVISGHEAALDRALDLAKEAGAKRAVKLAVSIAAHSPLMQVVQDEFKQKVEATSFQTPAVPIYANITAQVIATPEAIHHELSQQLTQPVYWTDSVRNMIDAGIERFIEIGSGNVLTGLLKRIERSKTGLVLNSVPALQQLTG